MSVSESKSAIVLELAEEFLARYRRGERPPLKEYLDRYPILADEIRDVFPALALMENIALEEEPLTSTATGPAEAPREERPEQLGDFRILREIGHGGMGIVYEAEQVSLGRHVALKVLPRKVLHDPERQRRFEREAKAAAKLHHTNIVPVFGVGEHDGQPYYVMQFIQGLGLDKVLLELRRMQARAASSPTDEPPRPEPAAASIARSLLTGRFPETKWLPGGSSELPATATAPPGPPPSEGVAPSSATLSSPSLPLPGQSEESGRSARKQTYWQSVAHVGAQVADALAYAHRQGILHRDIKPSNLLLDPRGTVWVADFGLAKTDEQENLTHTGDLLGTLRYMPPEAFEGRTDARGDVYSLGLTLYEMLALQPAFAEKDRHQLMNQVATQEPARLDRRSAVIPRDLVTIVHKAIERDRDHRYQTAAALADDLRRFLADEPIQARQASSWERILRWMRRRPTAAALIGVSILAVLAVSLAAISAFYNQRLTAAYESAEEARRQAEQARDAETQQREVAQHALRDAEQARDGELLLRGLLHARNGQWGEAASALAGIVQTHPGNADAWLGLAQAYAELGRDEESVAAFSRVLDLQPDSVTARTARAREFARLRRLGPALADYAEAFRHHPDLAEHAGAYADLLHERAAWIVPEVVELRSAGGAALVRLADGSIRAGGPNPDRETYTLTLRTPRGGITALRLETLPDSSLPGGGCGRARHEAGDFLLSEVSVLVEPARPGAKPRPLSIRRAWADVAAGASARSPFSTWSIDKTLDGDPKTGWSTSPHQNQPHVALFAWPEAVGAAEGTTLTVRLDFQTSAHQHSLGRFRLAVTTQPSPLIWTPWFAQAEANGWTKLGLARYLQGDDPAALDALQRAAASTPADDAAASLALSLVQDRLGKDDAARQSYEQASRQMQANPPDLVRAGLAVAAAARRIEREPDNGELRLQRGRWLALLQQHDAALADFTAFLERRPEDGAALLERGECHLLRGRPDRADTDFAAAARLSAAAVLDWHRSCLRLSENHPDQRRALLHHLGALIAARETPASELPTFLQQRIRLLLRRSRDADALPDLDRLVALQPANVRGLFQRAEVNSRLDRREQAAADFAQAFALGTGPKDHWGSERMAIDDELNRWDDVFTRVAKLRPTDELLWLGRAFSHCRRGQWRTAIEALQRVKELNPSNSHSWFFDAPLRLMLDDLDGYRQDCREMLERFGRTDSAYVADQIAKTCLLRPDAVKDRKLVAQLAAQAIAGGENEPDYAWFLTAKALADYRAGEHVRALKLLQTVAVDPDGGSRDVTLFTLLALVHQGRGQAEEARAALAKAQALLERRLPNLARGERFDQDWHNWLRCQILYREARERIYGEAKPADDEDNSE